MPVWFESAPMLAWVRDAAMRASWTNISFICSCKLRGGSIRLMQTSLSTPAAQVVVARKTSAIPPSPIRSTRRYLPKRSG